MPARNRVRCRVCKRHRDEVGPISWGGYCGVCGPAIHAQHCDDLHYHRGPGLLQWRQSMAASIGAVLIEDLGEWLDANGYQRVHSRP